MAQPPGSMPPGRRTPYETKRPLYIARRVQGIISAGHVGKKNKEDNKPIRLLPYPREYFITRKCKGGDKEIKLWRGKDGRFSEPPKPKAASP